MKRTALFLAALITVCLPQSIATAATNEGSKCLVAGKKSVSTQKTLVCTRQGKRLIWKRIVFAKPTPVIFPKSTLSNTSLFSNLEPCRIADGDPALSNMTAGFPIPFGRIDLAKGARITVLGVDFADKLGGTSSPKATSESKTSAVEKFWKAQSTVPVSFDWNWNSDWLHLPGSIKSYGLGGSFFEGKFNPTQYFGFVRNIITLADPFTDFSGTNFLFITFPPGITNDEIGTFLVHTQGSYSTGEGTIFNLIVAGGDYANADTYIHEFGHALGLTDIRDTQDVGNQKSDGMYYDIMNNPRYPELLVWHRFLLGFLEDQQIHCITSQEPSAHLLEPVAANTRGVKGLIIPISNTEAIVVESRRSIGYDTALSGRNDLQGVVVYTLDTKIPYRRSTVRVEKILKNNEGITLGGFNISVIETGSTGDVVKIEKSNSSVISSQNHQNEINGGR